MPTMTNKAKSKILVADSHENSRHIMAIMLHKLGYKTVLEAADREEAERELSRNIHENTGMAGLLGGAAPKETCDIDLLILDCDLAPRTGASYLQDLRRRFKPDQLPVLLVAMKGKERDLEAASRAGANDTLIKPFTSEAFRAKLDVLLGTGKAPVIQSFSFQGSTGGGEAKPASDKPEPKFLAAPGAPVSTGQARQNKSPAGGRSSFVGRARAVSYSTDGEPTAVLIDGKIDGHYHEKVDVIGGGQNCYWAKEVEGQDLVRLEYLSRNGRATGMLAKEIALEQFMYTFYLCEEQNCPILQRLAEERTG